MNLELKQETKTPADLKPLTLWLVDDNAAYVKDDCYGLKNS